MVTNQAVTILFRYSGRIRSVSTNNRCASASGLGWLQIQPASMPRQLATQAQAVAGRLRFSLAAMRRRTAASRRAVVSMGSLCGVGWGGLVCRGQARTWPIDRDQTASSASNRARILLTRAAAVAIAAAARASCAAIDALSISVTESPAAMTSEAAAAAVRA